MKYYLYTLDMYIYLYIYIFTSHCGKIQHRRMVEIETIYITEDNMNRFL